MNTQTSLHLCLTVHLIALTMAVGAIIANAIVSRQFWKLYDSNQEHGIAAFRGIGKLQLVGMLGLLLLIASGITMLWLYNWAYGEQLWFKIKMTCILLLFVNGFTLGRITTLKLARLIKEPYNSDAAQNTTQLRKNQSTFYFIQLLLFGIIIGLAVFRFI
jgi:hypothetical protein